MSGPVVTYLFPFIGGLGMFLYGMNVMSDGLQKKAGDRMKGLLNFLTKNRFMGVLVGALITAVIQSSSATTVMVVGFVNSGLMTLAQAVGIIMGANIGTTITAWIVSMSEWAAFMKPEMLAPVIMGIGAAMVIFTKSKTKKDIGEIMIGFALLFIGLTFMADAMKPLSKSPEFIDLFKTLGGHPLLGLLVGLVVTAIIQSSSASVGILQTLAATGSISTSAALFITLGQNIGTCVTALLSSAGASRVAKRAAIIHLLFNVIGTVLFVVLLLVGFHMYPTMGEKAIDSVGISIFHTIFNTTNTLVLFPFATLLVKASEHIIPKRKEEEVEVDVVGICKNHLDYRLLETPLSALNVVRDEVKHLGVVVEKNLARVRDAIADTDVEKAKKILEREKNINEMTVLITSYLVEITKLSLNDKQRLYIDDMLYTVNDIERVGDHCENIAELVMSKNEHGGEFSDTAKEEILHIVDLATNSYRNALTARNENDMKASQEAIKYEQTIDVLEEVYRKKHLERMSEGLCEPQIGVFFLDMISNLERISDHSCNIAGYVQNEV